MSAEIARQPTIAAPALPRGAVVAIVTTFAGGLLLDRVFGIGGQVVASIWAWAVFIWLLGRVDPATRRAMLLCVSIATGGEMLLSLGWGLYIYRFENVPPFVPPGHVLLFLLGLRIAQRLPGFAVPAISAAALGYGAFAVVTGHDTTSAVLALLLMLCLAVGSNRRLYVTVFMLALALELYGTALGSWRWAAAVPGLPLASANPPLCAGTFYCALDLLIALGLRIGGRFGLRQRVAQDREVNFAAPATRIR